LATFSAFSIYYLGTTIFRENKNRQLIGFVAAIAYMYNPLVMSDTYKSMVSQLSLAQAGLILFLALVIEFARTNKLRYAVYSGFTAFLILSTPGLGAYQYGFFALIGYLCVALYSVLLSRQNLWRLIEGSFVIGGIAIAINSYWLIPFVENASLYISAAANFQTTNAFSQSSTVINTLRLMNAWGFSYYTPYGASYFTNPLIVFLTFSWPIFAFFPLLFESVRKNLKALMIYIIGLITIVVACGANPPLGSLYNSIINAHLASFYFLRPFYTTGPISVDVLTIEFAILIGLFSSLVYSKLKNSLRWSFISQAVVVLIILTLILSTWPIVTGEVMRNWYSPSQYGVYIPQYYWEANSQLEKICGLEYRALLLPPTQIYIGTSWGYQGTSQFYNLMFNVPLVTGNEIPFGITTNKTLVNQVCSIYYGVPDINDTLDVINQTSKIVTWENDKAVSNNGSLQIVFNSTFEIGEWHEVELSLPTVETWPNFTHMIIQFMGELNLASFQIGIGDAKGYVGWWFVQNYLCQIDDGIFIPAETKTLITQNDTTITAILNLTQPDLSYYSIDNVTSVWVRYLVTNSSDNATLQIDKMVVATLLPNTQYYANLWADNNIKFLMVDVAIKDGAENDPSFWLQMLSNSSYFKLVWQKGTIYIFENMIF
jgi:hypothetical protein